VICAIFTAFTLGVVTVASRKLKSLDTNVILLNHMAVGVLLALTAMIFNTEATYFVYNSEQAFFLITGGVANAIAMNMWVYST
jgi:hypothetical protein